jgi:methionyl aminopeptidase
LTLEQQQGLRTASRLAADTLERAIESVHVGQSLDEIDKIVFKNITENDGYPSGIDFMHFPKSVCLSVNDVVSHGVPNDYKLQAGDYLNIDVVCYKDGCHGDNSAMVFLETDEVKVDEDIHKLARVTRESMFVAINECKPGMKFNRIGELITEYAHGHGYFVNEEFGGHGIGDHLHMPPLVHHNLTPHQCKEEMLPGMAFTIEPILMLSDQF